MEQGHSALVIAEDECPDVAAQSEGPWIERIALQRRRGQTMHRIEVFREVLGPPLTDRMLYQFALSA